MPRYFEFEISFREIKPRIWRQFLLPAGAAFQDLHWAIQDAGDWSDDHLFEFWRAKGRHDRIPIAGIPVDESNPFSDEDSEAPDAAGVPLASYFTRANTVCQYTYDFGDDWELDVKLARTVELDEEFPRRLLAGERAYPPEDCGGVYGYYECLAAVGQPDPAVGEKMDEDAVEERRDWLGDWTPDFDLAAAKDFFDDPGNYPVAGDDFEDEDDDELADEEDELEEEEDEDEEGEEPN